MKTYADLKGQDLRWVQPNLLKPIYDLRTLAGETVASVTRSGLLNEVDHVEAAVGRYRIVHKGAFQRIFEISAADQPNAPLYVFQHQHHRLTLPDGKLALWVKTTSTPRIAWQWQREDGTALLQITGQQNHPTHQLHLELGSAVEGTRLLLAMLGAYLILLYSDELE